MDLINNELVTKVISGLAICTNDDLRCSTCPYFGEDDCSMKLKADSLTVITAYQTQLKHVVNVNEKNVDKLITANMELEYQTDKANALEKENGELKENNARLAEQNKKLLEKEIENTKLRNENQTIREDNKYLDERNEKLVDELRHRDSKIRDLLAEIDRQNKELYHRREWEQLVRSQPTMILHTEPVKIESVDVNLAKVAKNANKATKACNDLIDALDKLDNLNIHVTKANNLRAMFGLPPHNTSPWEFAKVGDVFGVKTLCGNIVYYTVSRVEPNGIYNNAGAKFTNTIVTMFRLDDNGDLKLIWKHK